MTISSREAELSKIALIVVGTRPNFVKAAALVRALEAGGRLQPLLVHTGQHYDEELSGALFTDLQLQSPDRRLGIGGRGPVAQLAEGISALHAVIEETAPALVIVLGDVTSTLAGALAALHSGPPLVHIEAGLRSFDRSMPEEVNRVLVDAVADLLLCTEPSAIKNLLREGRPSARIALCGNLMIDTLLSLQPKFEAADAPGKHGLEAGNFALLTLHRPANVDDPQALQERLAGLDELAATMPILFPVHPRSRAALAAPELAALVAELDIRLLPPLGYLEFMGLLAAARLVLTDSGGIQEESTVLGVPCLTLRPNTERPITLHEGTNRLVPGGADELRAALRSSLQEAEHGHSRPALWDGRAGARCEEVLVGYLEAGLEGFANAAARAGVAIPPVGDSPELPRLPERGFHPKESG